MFDFILYLIQFVINYITTKKSGMGVDGGIVGGLLIMLPVHQSSLHKDFFMCKHAHTHLRRWLHSTQNISQI